MTVPEGKLSLADLAEQRAAIDTTASGELAILIAKIPEPLVLNQNIGRVSPAGIVLVQFMSGNVDDVNALIAWLQTLIP